MTTALPALLHQLDFMNDRDKAERLTTEAIETGGHIDVGRPTTINIHDINTTAPDAGAAIDSWIEIAKNVIERDTAVTMQRRKSNE